MGHSMSNQRTKSTTPSDFSETLHIRTIPEVASPQQKCGCFILFYFLFVDVLSIGSQCGPNLVMGSPWEHKIQNK